MYFFNILCMLFFFSNIKCCEDSEIPNSIFYVSGHHDISACPCFLSCRFACPCLTFYDFAPVIPHKSQACLHIHVCMSVNACLHVHVCLAACLHVHLDFFLRFCSCHKPQVPGHVCISLSACPYMHFCMSMFS